MFAAAMACVFSYSKEEEEWDEAYVTADCYHAGHLCCLPHVLQVMRQLNWHG
jgi:hypothetical protein